MSNAAKPQMINPPTIPNSDRYAFETMMEVLIHKQAEADRGTSQIALAVTCITLLLYNGYQLFMRGITAEFNLTFYSHLVVVNVMMIECGVGLVWLLRHFQGVEREQFSINQAMLYIDEKQFTSDDLQSFEQEAAVVTSNQHRIIPMILMMGFLVFAIVAWWNGTFPEGVMILSLATLLGGIRLLIETNKSTTASVIRRAIVKYEGAPKTNEIL